MWFRRSHLDGGSKENRNQSIRMPMKKNIFSKRSVFYFLSPVLMALLFAIPSKARADADPVSKISLPNDGWTWKASDAGEPNAKTMYVKKTGEAVSVRLNTFDVPISSNLFLTSVREKIMEKPDYAGAEVQMPVPKPMGGQTWDVFKIKRKDEINQEIWARKTGPGVVFMIIYTGAGDFYQQYYADFSKVLNQASAN